MGNLKRHYTRGQMVFVTIVCANREPFLAGDSNKEILVSILRELNQEGSCGCNAWVLLDDHAHLIVTDSSGRLSRWVQSLKLRFVRRHPQRPGNIWQKRYWDHVLRDQCDLHRHLDYVHHNPVKHGMALRSADYRWSSFRRFVRLGWYAEDWAHMSTGPESNDEYGE